MKQGRATVTGSDRKVEPRSTAVNPGYAGNIGLVQGSHADCGDFTPQITPMDAGRGYSAPAIGTTTHRTGSQGRHK